MINCAPHIRSASNHPLLQIVGDDQQRKEDL